MGVSAGRDRYIRYGYFELGGVITFAYQHGEVPKSKIHTSTSTSISILEMGAYEKVESSHRNLENRRLRTHSPTYPQSSVQVKIKFKHTGTTTTSPRDQRARLPLLTSQPLALPKPWPSEQTVS